MVIYLSQVSLAKVAITLKNCTAAHTGMKSKGENLLKTLVLIAKKYAIFDSLSLIATTQFCAYWTIQTLSKTPPPDTHTFMPPFVKQSCKRGNNFEFLYEELED